MSVIHTMVVSQIRYKMVSFCQFLKYEKFETYIM